MSFIISCSQSAFLFGHLISENILTTYELLHTVQTQKKGGSGRMAIKLDMFKAYDRIEWPFLKAVMKALKFKAQWTRLVISCVSTTVKYKVLVNGRPKKMIALTKGLRQGDPLSPYLFIMCAEGLSSMLNGAEQQRLIQGATITKGGTNINHLLFADDYILYSKATRSDWEKIQEILYTYEKRSGQTLNLQKSSILFSKATTESDKQQVIQATGSFIYGNYSNYLGLPALVGRSKYNTCMGIHS